MTDSQEQETSVTSKMWRGFKKGMNPVHSITAGFNFGRNFTQGSKEKRIAMAQSNAKEYVKLKTGLWAAFFNPPIWESIEEMEEGWGVNDDNREIILKNMRFERILYVAISIVAVYTTATMDLDSAVKLLLMLSGTLGSLFFILRTSILSWRISCLHNRVCPNYIEWLKRG